MPAADQEPAHQTRALTTQLAAGNVVFAGRARPHRREVKWYNAAKGFGFIALDGGGNDVFVHVSALQRAGIMGLSEGQRVYVGVPEGQKGPEAASIQVAN